MLERQIRKDHTEATFVLPSGQAQGPISVVGDFNHWQPGTHTLALSPDGTCAGTVKLPANMVHRIRYLAAGDYWFNDETADGYDGENSSLHTYAHAGPKG
ncbi:isoamylase early set domain-containing protein [Streptomyces xanthophaeus]|uniref:isoamylase early set domain-containing protein n=1 Tax=Streptomyces xanthophaeus TaxID=67385 RepID=UPI00398FB8AD